MKEVTMYQCGFCKKKYAYKGSVMRHEKKCYHNPIHKACASCGHFYQEVREFERENNCPISTKVPACSMGEIIGTVTHDEVGLPHSISSMKSECNMWIPDATENEEEY